MIIRQLANFQLLLLHKPTTSGRGQPHNTSYKYSPIKQVANNIILRECSSTLHQKTSWHLQHIVKIKYHTILHYTIYYIISFHAHAHAHVHAHVHVLPTNMPPPYNQQNQTELIHSIYTIEGLSFQLDINQDILIILLTQ